MNKLQVLGSPLGGVVPAPFLREHFSALSRLQSGAGGHPVDPKQRHLHRSGSCPASVVAGRNGRNGARSFNCGCIQRPPALSVPPFVSAGQHSLGRGSALGSLKRASALEPLGSAEGQRFGWG
jgi:hypothetical protein